MTKTKGAKIDKEKWKKGLPAPQSVLVRPFAEFFEFLLIKGHRSALQCLECI
jgi:hypothetical protein